MTKRERIQFLLIWLALGVLPLFLRPLWEPDEGRYAEIPREMLATGDWLTPRLNYVLYFEKPPFQYWLSALSMRLFGTEPWAARLPLALATLAAMWAAWRLARRLGAVVPMWAAFMAASCVLGFVCGQILTLDALFAACFVLTVMAAVESVAAHLERRSPLLWTLLAFGSLSLSLLVKGLAGPVLMGGILVAALPFAWSDLRLRKAILRVFLDPWGWTLFFAISVPWFVLVEQANPGHARFFFIHEHFQRYSSHVHARQGHSNWFLDKLYFVVVLGVGLLPWLSMSLTGFVRGLGFMRRKGPQTEQGPLLRWAVAMLVMAAAVPFAFFTLSGSKLPTYILPAIVPMVALAAAFEEAHESWGALRRSGWELLFLGLVFGIGLPLVMKDGSEKIIAQDPAALGWMLSLGVVFLALGFWARRPVGLTGNRWMAAMAGALLLLTVSAQRLEGRRKSVTHLVAKAPANAQWISHGYYFQGIAVATGRRVPVIDGTGELRFGSEKLSREERELWFQENALVLNDMAARLRREDPSRPVWAISDRDSWKTYPEELKAAWEVVERTPSAWLIRLR